MTTQPDTGAYASVPDFIYGITREIWEERGISGKLNRYYAPDILLRAATGFTGSNTGVTAQTLQTLHQFPDRQLVGEDVIWTDGGDGSFLSSHRLTSVMTHTGDGILGKAHGKVVRSALGYLASFPDAAFEVHAARINREPEQPLRLALRWSLTGAHTGFGHFGEPTGAPVYVMGMSHFTMTQARVTAEYLVTDEVAIWKQIHAHVQSAAGS